jgi:hypothetical protein
MKLHLANKISYVSPNPTYPIFGGANMLVLNNVQAVCTSFLLVKSFICYNSELQPRVYPTQLFLLYQCSALANTTKKTYRSQLKSYLTFCSSYRVEPVPPSQETLNTYMAYLARTLSSNSIQGYNWDLKMIFKGISRQLGQPPKQKSPVMAQILLLLQGTLDDSPFDHAFWYGCLIAYYGFLRKSSLMPPSGPLLLDKYIARKDVTNVMLTSFTVVIKSSKTIQFGQRVH